MAIFAKLGLKGIDSTLATTIRAVVMAGFLTLVSFFLKKFQDFSFKLLDYKDLLLIVLAGIAGALSWLFYFLALKSGPATKVVVIDRLSFIFVIILAALFLGEHLGWRTALGALFMIIGAVIITLR